MALGCHLFGWKVEYTAVQPVRRLSWMLDEVLMFRNGAGGRQDTPAEDLARLLGR